MPRADRSTPSGDTRRRRRSSAGALHLALRCAFASLGPIFAAPVSGTPLDAPEARASYSLGHQIGSDLARQGREIDLDALRQGLQDALAGREAALPEDEREALLVGLKRGILRDERATRLRGASALRRAGEAVLAENARRPDVVSLPSGLQYRVIREGSGPRPGPEDRVTVRYRSTRLDGTAFHDSLREGSEPETFPVQRLLPGLIEAVQRMEQGARWEIFLPPHLGFAGRGPLEDQTLTYDLELLEVRRSATATGEAAP